MRGVEKHWKAVETFNLKFSSFSVHLNLVFPWLFVYTLCTFFRFTHRDHSPDGIARKKSFCVRWTSSSSSKAATTFANEFNQHFLFAFFAAWFFGFKRIRGEKLTKYCRWSYEYAKYSYRKLMTKLICRLRIHTIIIYLHMRIQNQRSEIYEPQQIFWELNSRLDRPSSSNIDEWNKATRSQNTHERVRESQATH